ncbi:MAG: 4'-phosphopantetheinyl transferase family protein [Pseudanabaenaceae cyanobacterium]
MGRVWHDVTAAGPAGLGPLAPGEIRLWRLAVGYLPTETLREVLPPAEQIRCPHLHFGTGRWLLRQVLGGLLGCHPFALRFAYTAAGKPYLPNQPLRFNLTHSRGMVLLAVTAQGEVGIDVEWSGRPVAVTRLAQRFFPEEEQAWLKRYDPADFWAMWTCKEAYAKLRGESLGSCLRWSTVSILQRWQAGQTTAELDGVLFEALVPHPEYRGVLAWQAERPKCDPVLGYN